MKALFLKNIRIFIFKKEKTEEKDFFDNNIFYKEKTLKSLLLISRLVIMITNQGIYGP